MEWDFETLRHRIEDFSRRHPLFELVVPRWSLLSGRGLRVSAEKWSGEWAIEDTPIRYAWCDDQPYSLWRRRAPAWKTQDLGTGVVLATRGIPSCLRRAVHIDGGLVNNLPTDIIRDMVSALCSLSTSVAAPRLANRVTTLHPFQTFSNC
jgi:hypothetical protein